MNAQRTADRIAICQHPNGEGVWWGLTTSDDGRRCIQDCDCTPRIFAAVEPSDETAEPEAKPLNSCPRCEQPVNSARTRSHRTIHLEADPHLDGTWVLEADGFAISVSGANRNRKRSEGVALYREHECDGRRPE